MISLCFQEEERALPPAPNPVPSTHPLHLYSTGRPPPVSALPSTVGTLKLWHEQGPAVAAHLSAPSPDIPATTTPGTADGEP